MQQSRQTRDPRFKVKAADPGPLELRTVDGTVIPGSIRMMGPDRVFGPDTPPAPEQRLTLHYRLVCLDGGTPNPTEGTFSFTTAPPVEMELLATELVMTEKGIVYAGQARHMIVRYDHTLPDRSAGAWHITDTTWTISGRPYATIWHPGAVFSYCSPPMNDWRPDSCGTYGAVPAGKHLLQAHTRIVGVEQEFVAQLEVDTSCDQVLTTGTSSEPPDGGASDALWDTGQPDGQAVGPVAGPEEAKAGDEAAACAMAGGRGSSWGLAVLVLVGFATVTWRQRRR